MTLLLASPNICPFPTKSNSTMSPKDLIDKLGGTTAVAKMLGIKPPSVHAWRAATIPDDKLVFLAVVAEDRGIATRKELLPDTWQRIWPEIVDESAANEQ